MFPYTFPASFPSAEVLPQLSWSQSVDGKIITLKDNFDYSSQGKEPSDYQRTVDLFSDRDASGTLLDTLLFGQNDLSVSKNITEDQYFSAKITYLGIPEISPFIINFGTTGIVRANIDKLLDSGCSCGLSDKDKEKAYFASLYMQEAEDAVMFGNSSKFNKYIKMAAAWLQ